MLTAQDLILFRILPSVLNGTWQMSKHQVGTHASNRKSLRRRITVHCPHGAAHALQLSLEQAPHPSHLVWLLSKRGNTSFWLPLVLTYYLLSLLQLCIVKSCRATTTTTTTTTSSECKVQRTHSVTVSSAHEGEPVPSELYWFDSW